MVFPLPAEDALKMQLKYSPPKNNSDRTSLFPVGDGLTNAAQSHVRLAYSRPRWAMPRNRRCGREDDRKATVADGSAGARTCTHDGCTLRRAIWHRVCGE